MSTQFTFNPKLDFAIERFIDAPARLVWEALTKPEHLKEWYMPKAWGRVSRAEMDVRPGGIFSIDIAGADGQEFPNLGCFLDVIPMKRLVWTSMLFPGYRPAVFDDIPITAIVTMEAVGACVASRVGSATGRHLPRRPRGRRRSRRSQCRLLLGSDSDGAT
ncbi:MAG TPA: SRPBCC domain-containing protein, partial [Nitrospiraceae bacterium]|nr:SRPBCC domain-containing protein [Nitrospiraceae bacterium]